MPTHTMSRNTDPTTIELRERSKDRLRQFLRDIAVHVITRVVGGFSRVDVEASPRTKVISIIFAFDVEPACSTLATYLS